MEFLLVAIGGAFGSLSRYKLGLFIAKKYSKSFPLGTFLINLTGAFALGILNGLSLSKSGQLLFMDGFLAAYTTFSTYLFETFQLFEEGERRTSVGYLSLSILLGVLCYFLGFLLV